MKKNSFYLLVGCIALVLLVIFWYSIENSVHYLTETAFVIGVIIIYFARKQVTDLVEDERSAKITEKAALADTPGFLGIVRCFCNRDCDCPVSNSKVPPGIQTPRPGEVIDTAGDIPSPKLIGYLSLGLLCM